MAQGLAVALPLGINEFDGAYGLHKDLISMAEQNLKMLILTSKGERCMSPNFGVGIRSYLFEQNTPGTISGLKADILAQVARYLPYISITDLQVFSPAMPRGTTRTPLRILVKHHLGP